MNWLLGHSVCHPHSTFCDSGITLWENSLDIVHWIKNTYNFFFFLVQIAWLCLLVDNFFSTHIFMMWHILHSLILFLLLLSIEVCFSYIYIYICLWCASLFIAKWYGVTITIRRGRLSVHAFRHDSPDMLCTNICSHIRGQVLKISNPLMTKLYLRPSSYCAGNTFCLVYKNW